MKLSNIMNWSRHTSVRIANRDRLTVILALGAFALSACAAQPRVDPLANLASQSPQQRTITLRNTCEVEADRDHIDRPDPIRHSKHNDFFYVGHVNRMDAICRAMDQQLK